MSGNVDLRYEVWRLINDKTVEEAKRLWNEWLNTDGNPKFLDGNNLLRATIPLEYQIAFIAGVHKEWLYERLDKNGQ